MDTFMPWPALAVWVWQASPAMKTRGERVPTLSSSTSSNLSVDPVADPVDREPRGLLDLERVRSQDTAGLIEDLLRREPGVGGDLTHVDVEAQQVAALAGDEQDVAAVAGLDRALNRMSGKSVTASRSMTPQALS